ncbi:hypothetical protein ACGFX8_34185 [Streptomyces sp. NPDC048362]|uniref:hypothetical protein n=1 Tax=Streptomyces sp. NPDC048362 TaxID=3365539 RepID=UPI0037163249
MPSFAGDPRHERLVAVLVPLLRRSCPSGGGGFGGSYELRLAVDEAEALGGMDLIRSAMRKAARSLGWSRLQTFGGVYRQVAVAGVVDRREVPEEFASVVEGYRLDRMAASAEVISETLKDGRRRAVPGSVLVTTQEFRAAFAAAEGVAG